MAGRKVNGKGIEGTAPGADLVLLKAWSENQGNGSISGRAVYIWRAMEYAVDIGADVLV